jgi:hypothetical protein
MVALAGRAAKQKLSRTHSARAGGAAPAARVADADAGAADGGAAPMLVDALVEGELIGAVRGSEEAAPLAEPAEAPPPVSPAPRDMLAPTDSPAPRAGSAPPDSLVPADDASEVPASSQPRDGSEAAALSSPSSASSVPPTPPASSEPADAARQLARRAARLARDLAAVSLSPGALLSLREQVRASTHSLLAEIDRLLAAAGSGRALCAAEPGDAPMGDGAAAAEGCACPQCGGGATSRPSLGPHLALGCCAHDAPPALAVAAPAAGAAGGGADASAAAAGGADAAAAAAEASAGARTASAACDVACAPAAPVAPAAVGLLEAELSCQICLCVYADPHSLPCQHAFCRACILATMKARKVNECTQRPRATHAPRTRDPRDAHTRP